MNTPSLSSTEVYMEDLLYIPWEVYCEQNEPSFNFVYPCIGKLWLVVEALVDFKPNALCTNCLISYPVLYLHDGLTWKVVTWPTHS